MAYKVFIDGQDGTTGLGIRESLAERSDVELLELPAPQRKDASAKRDVLAQADVAVLCLPDDAAVETVGLAADLAVKIVDASTAHRTHPGWVYGLPELTPDARQAIAGARLVANPGCYPTGFLLAVRPLVDARILPPDAPITVHAVSGYSGGGKKLIAAFDQHSPGDRENDWAARPYALGLAHKHLAEMRAYARLEHAPVFNPFVADFYHGMLVSVPLATRLLRKAASSRDVHEILAGRYAGERFVRVMPLGGGPAMDGGFLSATACNGTNRVELFVFGNDEQVVLIARLDNLGKGASGAAIQNVNLLLGIDEHRGLL